MAWRVSNLDFGGVSRDQRALPGFPNPEPLEREQEPFRRDAGGSG